MKIINWTVLLCMYIVCVNLSAQEYKTNDTLYIQSIDIKSNKIKSEKNNFSLNNKAYKTKFKASNFSNFFSQQNNLFFKNFGNSSISTVSIRGGNASQSLVLWNDLPISNAMLGLSDFSLIPLFIFDSVDFSIGSNSALYGSGALNASFNLKNSTNNNTENSLELFSNVGSFNLFSNGIKLKLCANNFSSKTAFYQLNAENDFPIEYSALKFNQRHSKSKQWHVAQSFWLNPLKNNRLKSELNFWLQNVQRQIPAHLNQNQSVARQEDFATRINLNTNYALNNGKINSKIAYFDEALNYYDELSSVNSESKIKTLHFELSNAQKFKLIDLNYGINLIDIKVVSNQYSNFNKESRNSIFLLMHKKFEKLSLNFNARQYLVNRKLEPTSLKLEGKYFLNHSSELYVSTEKVYRLPSLNDKYWAHGGQLDLNAETGFASEIGYTFNHFYKIIKLNYQSNIFLNQINNWIIWTQPIQQLNFVASNIPSVLSKGLEQKIEIEANAKATKLKASVNYHYTQSSYKKLNEFDLPKFKVGDQLIYTPLHRINCALALSKKYLSFQTDIQFTGKTSGIQQDLEAYTLLNFGLQYQNVYNNLPYTLFLNLNNILNKNYFIIEYRPMPRFNFEIGLSTKFKTKN